MPETLEVVGLEGALGIEHAETTRSRLKELLSKNKSVRVNLSKVESIDLSIVQVLIAAKKTARQKGLKVMIENQMSPGVIRAFWLSGMVNRLDSKDIDHAIDEHLQGNL